MVKASKKPVVPNHSDSDSSEEVEDEEEEEMDEDEVEDDDDKDIEEKEEEISEDEEEKKVDVSSLDLLLKSDRKKEVKPGIIYLSTIPPKMNVRQTREYFEKFGELNRSFLQPDTITKPWKGKGRPKNQIFTEGWIEFKKRRHAKKVAKLLNNCPVGGKKSKEYHDHLWNIKYLPGFQWVHLNERLAYERISKQSKLRAEVSAAKRETSFFAKNVELSRKLKKQGILTKSGRPVDPDNLKHSEKSIKSVKPSSKSSTST